MKQISLIALFAFFSTLIGAAAVSAARPSTPPVETVLMISDIRVTSTVAPVQLEVDVVNNGIGRVNVAGNFSYVHLCPGNESLSGTMTPSVNCTQENTIGQVTQSISLDPLELGTLTIEFESPFSIAPGDDYIFFTQIVCAGGGGSQRCDGYLHSFFGLDQ